MLDEHESDLETQRVIHVHYDKGLTDREIQTAPQGAPWIVDLRGE